MEVTFDTLLDNLNTNQELVPNLLDNLQVYCIIAKYKAEEEPDLLKLDPSKMFFKSKKNSHSDEIEGRLQFLEYYATESSFLIKKAELRAIFDLLTSTCIESDTIAFYNWCSNVFKS